jgi:hypothetical protein
LTQKRSELSLDEIILQTIKRQSPETVEQLVENILQQDNSLSKTKIMNRILKLESDGLIVFKEGHVTTQKITAYVHSSKAWWYWITISFALVTASVVFSIPQDAYPLVYIRYFLGSFFVLWLPGYSLIKAFFPTEPPLKIDSKALDSLMQMALSVGLSICVVPIMSLLLFYTPWGLNLASIVLSLLTLTLFFATIGIIREHKSSLRRNS